MSLSRTLFVSEFQMAGAVQRNARLYDSFQRGERCVVVTWVGLMHCCQVVTGSSRGHNVLQVLPDESQLHCWRLHQWSGCAVGHFTARRPTHAVAVSWQGQRYLWHAGTMTLQFFLLSFIFISYRSWNIASHLLKVACMLCAPIGSDPLEFHQSLWHQKARVCIGCHAALFAWWYVKEHQLVTWQTDTGP